jgi:egghead protein (zeste-white 4 protein)
MNSLSDSMRVSQDLGPLRFSLKYLNIPIMNFKGSFFVCQHGVEKSVTFDHGLEGSIPEDTFFVIKASNKGYSFDWIDGEMQEQSPFTFMDIVRQRRRWHQGTYLVAFSKNLKRDLTGRFYQLQFYNTCFATLGTSTFFFSLFFPYSFHPLELYFDCLLESCQLYFYCYGIINNFNMHKYSLLTKSCMFLAAPIVVRYMFFYHILSFIWALASSKSGFQIVKKSKENEF